MNQEKGRHVDSKYIHFLYKLTHPELEQTFRRLRDALLEQFDEFKKRLVCALNNLNYFRYMRSFPQDDIKFVFRERVNVSASEERYDQKEQVLGRMAEFQVMKTDWSGVADNCIYEIQKYLSEKPTLLKFEEICPSGNTFLEHHKESIDTFLPYWQEEPSAADLTAIFKETGPQFPKEEIKKLGAIFSDNDLAVMSARLIYRASQHNFQSASFKDQCVGRGPTLLLAKSDKGMIFGGFTPAKWIKSKDKEFIPDPSGKSFLFSLSKKLSFPIKESQKQYAISSYGGWGPIYGSPYGPDLSISDKCHLNEHSCSSLGSHYDIPPNIKQYSNEAFSLLAGSKKFKVIEYEMYELLMEQ